MCCLTCEEFSDRAHASSQDKAGQTSPAELLQAVLHRFASLAHWPDHLHINAQWHELPRQLASRVIDKMLTLRAVVHQDTQLASSDKRLFTADNVGVMQGLQNL